MRLNGGLMRFFGSCTYLIYCLQKTKNRSFYRSRILFFSVHFSVHFCLFFCRENALFNSGKHCTLYYKVRKIQFFEFYYACNNRLFRRQILSGKSCCCKHRFCIPYGTQNLLVRECPNTPKKSKMTEQYSVIFSYKLAFAINFFCSIFVVLGQR